jgi:hypothetical protein
MALMPSTMISPNDMSINKEFKRYTKDRQFVMEIGSSTPSAHARETLDKVPQFWRTPGTKDPGVVGGKPPHRPLDN